MTIYYVDKNLLIDPKNESIVQNIINYLETDLIVIGEEAPSVQVEKELLELGETKIIDDLKRIGFLK